MSHDDKRKWDRADAFLAIYEWLDPLVDWVFCLINEVVPGIQNHKLPQSKMDALRRMLMEFGRWSIGLNHLMKSPLSFRLVRAEESIHNLLFQEQVTFLTFESGNDAGDNPFKSGIKIDGLDKLCGELEQFGQWLSDNRTVDRAELSAALRSTALKLNTQLNEIALTALGLWGYEFAKNPLECLPDDFFEQFDTGDPDLRMAVAELIREASLPKNPFVPTPLQSSILDALDGKAYKKEDLAWEVGLNGDGSRLYRPGVLDELRKRGLVVHKFGVGYYRPDSPPPN